MILVKVYMSIVLPSVQKCLHRTLTHRQMKCMASKCLLQIRNRGNGLVGNVSMEGGRGLERSTYSPFTNA